MEITLDQFLNELESQNGSPQAVANEVRQLIAQNASGRGAGYDEIASNIGQPSVVKVGNGVYNFSINLGNVAKESLRGGQGVYNLGGLFDVGWTTQKTPPTGFWKSHGIIVTGLSHRDGSNWIDEAVNSIGEVVNGDYKLASIRHN